MSLIGHSLWDSEPQSLNTLCPYNSFHITIHSLYKTPQTSGEQVMCWLPKKPRAAIQHHKAGLSNGVGTRSVGTRPPENLSLAELTFYSQKREGENPRFPKLCLQGCMAKWQSFKHAFSVLPRYCSKQRSVSLKVTGGTSKWASLLLPQGNGTLSSFPKSHKQQCP